MTLKVRKTGKTRLTNGPVLPGHVLFSCPALKKISSTKKYRWANKELEEEKQDKEEEN